MLCLLHVFVYYRLTWLLCNGAHSLRLLNGFQKKKKLFLSEAEVVKTFALVVIRPYNISNVPSC